MGVGKTSLGRGLSKKLNLPHIDTDFEIEKVKNMKISSIFESYGESYFRELEQNIIIDIFSKNQESVISLGGGSFLNIKIREHIKNKCISIWLNANVDTIYKRITKSNNIRPVFSRLKSKNDLEVLLHERSQVYKEADIKIDSENLNKYSLVEKVLYKIDDYLEKKDENY